MRRLLMVLLMLTVAGTAMASITGNVSDRAPKVTVAPPENPLIRVTGDTIGDPFTVTGIPFQGIGNTTGWAHDYDEICPYSGSLAPDVVYAYLATGTPASITIDLCYSGYDTKVFVYDDVYTPGAPYACNDDFYFALPCYTYASKIANMPVVAGHTYYIVVDGYGSQFGAYQLDIIDPSTIPTGACCFPSGSCTITEQAACTGIWQGESTVCEPNPCPPPQPVVCPPGALLEVEPDGGCNEVPNNFMPLNPQAAGCATMCGTAWANSGSRDTDWLVSIGTGALMTGTAVGEFPMQYLLIYGTDCAAPSYLFGTGDPGVPVTLSWTVGDGDEVWNWIGSSAFADWPESDWVFDICGIKNPPPPPGACCRNGVCIMTDENTCLFFGGIFYGSGVQCSPTVCEPVPTAAKSWGQLKNLYR